MNYLHWEEKTIGDFSESNISQMYNEGYLFTRINKGVLHQTRSARINLADFELSSENRRILKKVEGLNMTVLDLPLKDYDWSIGKLGKDFYESRFGPGIMSAQKIKELLTDGTKSNFNKLLVYSQNDKNIGYTIVYENENVIHYSYPFYDIDNAPKDIGLGMMTLAIQAAKEQGKKYIYLGSLQRPNDTYKLQFESLEWFDNKVWHKDLEKVKEILAS